MSGTNDESLKVCACDRSFGLSNGNPGDLVPVIIWNSSITRVYQMSRRRLCMVKVGMGKHDFGTYGELTDYIDLRECWDLHIQNKDGISKGKDYFTYLQKLRTTHAVWSKRLMSGFKGENAFSMNLYVAQATGHIVCWQITSLRGDEYLLKIHAVLNDLFEPIEPMNLCTLNVIENSQARSIIVAGRFDGVVGTFDYSLDNCQIINFKLLRNFGVQPVMHVTWLDQPEETNSLILYLCRQTQVDIVTLCLNDLSVIASRSVNTPIPMMSYASSQKAKYMFSTDIHYNIRFEELSDLSGDFKIFCKSNTDDRDTGTCLAINTMVRGLSVSTSGSFVYCVAFYPLCEKSIFIILWLDNNYILKGSSHRMKPDHKISVYHVDKFSMFDRKCTIGNSDLLLSTRLLLRLKAPFMEVALSRANKTLNANTSDIRQIAMSRQILIAASLELADRRLSIDNVKNLENKLQKMLIKAHARRLIEYLNSFDKLTEDEVLIQKTAKCFTEQSECPLPCSVCGSELLVNDNANETDIVYRCKNKPNHEFAVCSHSLLPVSPLSTERCVLCLGCTFNGDVKQVPRMKKFLYAPCILCNYSFS
ncbi:hypothetical protein ACOME3_007015 [Neoechinorhynchus agilis]